MKNLLPCPICERQPILSSLEPEYKKMKYFCGVHVACGDWQKTKKLAAEDWNRRVQEHKDAIERLNTPGTPEFLEKQGNLRAYVCCEDCGYTTDTIKMKDLIFKISMEGGYIISDKDGGYFSQCPKCESEKLALSS